MNEIITLLPLITVFIIFYVILYIPQRRRQKKHKEYVENLKIGDNVITDSGIFGRVVNIKILKNLWCKIVTAIRV